MKRNIRSIMQHGRGFLAAISLTAAACGASSGPWMQEFHLEGRGWAATGENRYFVLKPGFQTVLEGKGVKVVITVLDQTRKIGEVTTRVVEEREEKNGRLVEVSKNYFAISRDTGDVFYFGEDVDEYKNGKIHGHDGAWRADEEHAKPGMMMPGSPSVGAKYYQEVAPGRAMDRAEIVSTSEAFKTPAGTFTNCLKTKETTPLNLFEKSFKTYAPGIGLIQDGDQLLVKYGFVKTG